MFEEICLTCSKHLVDDNRVYCSDECERLDAMTSPSISSASSVLSSPRLDYVTGGDVPPLVPSALGSALKRYRRHDRFSVSSSSVSSVPGSVFADDCDDSALVDIGDDHAGGLDTPDTDPSVYEGTSKAAGMLKFTKASELYYARRPSTTDNRSTVPLLHHRTSSISSSGVGRGPSHSVASIHSLTLDDLESAVDIHSDEPQMSAGGDRGNDVPTITPRSKRNRNRASLPAYFSLLQTSASIHHHSPLPLSSSSGHTIQAIPCRSPSTPKLALTSSIADPISSLVNASGLPSAAETTPRGRRREPGQSRSSHRSRQSRSGSRSESRVDARQISREQLQPNLRRQPRTRLDNQSSVEEQVFDWSLVPQTHVWPSFRRNSSPLPTAMAQEALPRDRV